MISDTELVAACEWETGEDERHVAGTDEGWPVDVGHDDLLCGLASPTHWYPPLDRFLRGS